jgi:hypothetical protein
MWQYSSFFRKIMANIFKSQNIRQIWTQKHKKGILCGNFILFSEKYPQFLF